MNVHQRLSPLLERLARLRLLRGLAVVLPAAAALSAVLAWWVVRTGFDNQVVWMARAAGVAVLALLGWRLIGRPLSALRKRPEASIESSTPVFEGRLETWAQAPADNPLRPLLAADVARITEQHPPESLVAVGALRGGALAAASGAIALILLAAAGPGFLGHGVRHLWAGWALSGLKPQQQIQVSPGDQTVRRGGRLPIRAAVSGFAPAAATVHARNEGGQWRSAPMHGAGPAFDFTFVAIRDPVDYYISAAGVRSPQYRIEVVDLPQVASASMTLHFPEWTGRSPQQFDSLADIRAVGGTRAEVELQTETPLPAGELVVDGAGSALAVNGRKLSGTLAVDGDGQFFVAALVGGEQVRLTQDYFITQLADEPPRTVFEQPGRDTGATAVEEVTLKLSARDDYALESVALHVAVNGQDRPPVLLTTGASQRFEHVLMLENLGEDGFLQPGDVISYYAVARDRASEQTSDLFFIDVQPFDRRITQSQMSGSGGGNAGDGSEISQRQKEIILSTWNLKRERGNASLDEAQRTANNIRLLAELQSTLAQQATTLADRARARQLGSDPAIDRFISHLDQAVEAMHPAVAQLKAEALEAALQHEQQALQHLLRAEAVFTDIQVSFSSSQDGGGQRGRDLAEMLELEMDLEKNQYETGSQARPPGQDESADDTLQQLEELARRQQQLADQARQGQPTPAQRWRQEALRREAERLREQLQRLAGGSQTEPSGSGADQQATEPGSESPQRSELQRRMDSALRAMDEAAREMAEGGDPENLERATREAQAQLEAAQRAAALDRQQSLADAFATIAEQARDLHQRQARLARDLERAVDEAEASRTGDGSGMDPVDEYELAARKRDLLKALQELDQDMRVTAQQFAETAPRASDELRRAAEALARSEAPQRLGVAAEYIDYGAAVYIVSSEGMVTEALEELAEATRQARDLATARDLRSSDDVAQALAELRGLRRELDQLAEGAAPGQDPARSEAPAAEESTGGTLRPSQEGGGFSAQGGAGGDRATTGAWFDSRDRRRAMLEEPAVQRQLRRDLAQAAGQTRRILPELRGQGISEAELANVRALLDQMDLSQFSGNPALLDAEFSRLLALVQQLELALSQASDDTEGTRAGATTALPARYRQAIADYYSRLSEVEQSPKE